MEENRNFEIESRISEIDRELDDLDIQASKEIKANELDQLIAKSKELRSERSALIKELKALEKSNKEKTKFDNMPLGLKVFFIVSCIIFFPVVSWGYIPLWFYTAEGLCSLFYNVINSLMDYKILGYGLFGFFWFLFPLIGIIWSLYVLPLRKKTDDKKTFFILFFVAILLMILMIIYQITQWNGLFNGTL